jgi:probable F420-dependent oxidoreductase
MKFGVCYFPTDYGMSPDTLAVAAEERGFESLLFCEHTHIPVSRKTPYPLGGELPQMYLRTYDPFVACMAGASATTTINIGTGICLVVQRDPITTAKEVASVDRLSGGRFLFGVGAGWNKEEMENHGTDPRTRMALMGERLEAMRALWSSDVAEYHGKFVDFTPSWLYPKPLQDPLPVLVGGMGPTVEKRVLKYGNEWLAECVGTGSDLDEFAVRVGTLQKRAAEQGRNRIPVSMFDAQSSSKEAFDRYAAAGVDRCLFQLPDGDAETVVPELDRLAALVS